MGSVFLMGSFTYLLGQYDQAQALINNNVYIFETKNTKIKHDTVIDSSADKEELITFLNESFAKDSNIGSFVFVQNSPFTNYDYDNILILFGSYSECAGFPSTSDLEAYVPENKSNEVGESISFSLKNINVAGTYSDDFSLFHPTYYFDSNHFNNTLILCCNDFETVNSMFPWDSLSTEVFFRMIVVNPSDEDLKMIEQEYYENFNEVYLSESAETAIQRSTLSTLRAYKLYLIFYVIAGVIFFICTLLNLTNLIKNNLLEYTVHYIYGATLEQIQLRVKMLILILNVIPFIGLLIILYFNRMTQASLILVLAFLVLFMCWYSSTYVKNKIVSLNALEEMRGEQ